MMKQTLYALFSDSQAAAETIDRLVALGISHDSIRMVGAGARDHMGGFADTDTHTHSAERDHVGGFADTEAHIHTPERDHVGGFADTEAHIHTPERDMVGSFASTDRGSTQPSEAARPLIAAGLSPAEAATAAQGIAAGAVLVLVQVFADQADAVARVLGQ
jgi:hypothetical protein